MNLYAWVYYIAQFFLIRETLGPGGEFSTLFKFYLFHLGCFHAIKSIWWSVSRFPSDVSAWYVPSENLVSAHHLEISTREITVDIRWIKIIPQHGRWIKDRAGSGNESPQTINRSVIVVMDNPPFIDELYWIMYDECPIFNSCSPIYRRSISHFATIGFHRFGKKKLTKLAKVALPEPSVDMWSKSSWRSVWPLVKTDQISSVNIIGWLVNGCSFQVLRNKTR